MGSNGHPLVAASKRPWWFVSPDHGDTARQIIDASEDEALGEMGAFCGTREGPPRRATTLVLRQHNAEGCP